MKESGVREVERKILEGRNLEEKKGERRYGGRKEMKEVHNKTRKIKESGVGEAKRKNLEWMKLKGKKKEREGRCSRKERDRKKTKKKNEEK